MSLFAPAPRAGAHFVDALRGDAFPLTRALTFTRDAYRHLWGRGRQTTAAAGSAEGGASDEARPALRIASAARPFRSTRRKVAAAPPAVLTPWELIDEDASPDGVAFTQFQRRPRPSRLHVPSYAPPHPMSHQQAA